MSLKNPVTTPGIDPGTVRLVALPQAASGGMKYVEDTYRFISMLYYSFVVNTEVRKWLFRTA
jgi:hypothetical protein